MNLSCITFGPVYIFQSLREDKKELWAATPEALRSQEQFVHKRGQAYIHLLAHASMPILFGSIKVLSWAQNWNQ